MAQPVMPDHICSLDPKEGSEVLQIICGRMMKAKWIEPVLTRSLEEDGSGLVVLNTEKGISEDKITFIITAEFVYR
jgi:hypothetical protein